MSLQDSLLLEPVRRVVCSHHNGVRGHIVGLPLLHLMLALLLDPYIPPDGDPLRAPYALSGVCWSEPGHVNLPFEFVHPA